MASKCCRYQKIRLQESDLVDFATMRVGLSGTQTLANMNTEYTLNLDTLRYSNGSGLIHGQNAIRIGSGVKRVLVSGQVYWFDRVNASSQAAGSQCVQYIYLNSDFVVIVNGRETSNYLVRSFGSIVLDVKEGDVISVKAKNEHSTNCTIGANPTNTWLQVVVIG